MFKKTINETQKNISPCCLVAAIWIVIKHKLAIEFLHMKGVFRHLENLKNYAFEYIIIY